METEFIYWRHPSIPGIKIEEVCGGEDKSGALWKEMAYQVYSENGKDGFREIGHYRNGAPFVYGEDCRISISHADRLLVVATLPPTPEVDLSSFTPRAAMGVDAEATDRAQVLKIRERFLSDAELDMIPAGDLQANIIAWTAKEAIYKAAMTEGLDFRTQIVIGRMPGIAPATTVYDKEEFPEISIGHAVVHIPAKGSFDLSLYSYESEGHIVTLAYSPQCAKFSKRS